MSDETDLGESDHLDPKDVDIVIRFAYQLEAIQRVGSALKKIESVQSWERECKSRLESAKKKALAAETALQDTIAHIEAERVKFAKDFTESNTAAVNIIAVARDKAGEEMRKGEALHTEMRTKWSAEISDLRLKATAAKDDLASISKMVAEKQERLADIEKKLAEIRGKA